MRLNSLLLASMTTTAHTLSSSSSSSRPLMVVLVGLPGCGKGYFAKQLVDASMAIPTTRPFAVVNQDVFKNRDITFQAGRDYVLNNYHLIVDRCNMDVQQRQHSFLLAHETECTVIAVVLNRVVNGIIPRDDLQLSIERATTRGVDALHPPTDWSKVCGIQRSQFVMPTTSEGFDRVFECYRDVPSQGIVEDCVDEVIDEILHHYQC